MSNNRVSPRINEIVKDVLADQIPDAVIWASGGDGGHIAITTPDCIEVSLQLIAKFRRWSEDAGVRLRIVAHYGEVDQIEGAGGITQLVGPGINLAGRLIEYGDQNRVVVSKQFVDAAETVSLPGIRFHDERLVSLKYFPLQEVMLLSIQGTFESEWNDYLTDDRRLLNEALQQRRLWDVIYHSRRLLEVDADDQDAINGLLALSPDGLIYKIMDSGEERTNPLLAPMERYPRVDFIRSAQLVEREKGEILCRYQDDGDIMFVILRGEIAVLSGPDPQHREARQTSIAIQLGTGQIVGELAFALRWKRTATLQCLTRTVLLSFSPSTIKGLLKDSPSGPTIQRDMDRFVKLRILEYLCNNANYLIGRMRSGPLRELKNPWELLTDNTTLISCASEFESIISRQADEFKARGLYILVSGELREIQQSGCILLGTELPIVYADFQGEVLSEPKSYSVILDAIILHINPEAFVNTFIPRKTFQSLLHAVRDTMRQPENKILNMSETHQQLKGIPTMSKVKILFLAANPLTTSPLQLDREAREIEEKLRGTRERDKVELITKWALRPDDLQQYLLEHQPDVVHFSGHGNDANELILEDRSGNPQPVSQETLLALFRALKDNIRVVVLNACFSQQQAAAITETIDCAIGMNNAIGDPAAITFAASFYRALGFGRSVQTGFELGAFRLI